MKAAALLIIPLLALAAREADARMGQAIPLASGAQAKITLGSCFDHVPLGGYAPIDVTIDNQSGETRRWVIEFDSPSFAYMQTDRFQSAFTVTVENNGTRTIPLLVPTAGENRFNAPLGVRVTGYGAENTAQQMIGSQAYSGKTATRFVAISESLGTSIWSSLSSELNSHGKELTGSTVNPDELPEDWRGLSGVGAMWLKQDELNHLTAGQRQAIQTWLHMGGHLYLCDAAKVPDDFWLAGFGRVFLGPATLDVNDTASIISDLPAQNGPDFNTLSSPFASVAEPQPNVPLLGGFMGIFALVVGPWNIFVLARRRRVRLFWTTPLISIGASAALMGVIVLQDGAGGHGNRRAVVCLFPQSHSAVIVQEQISRTGLLLDSTFRTADPVLMEEEDSSPANQRRTLAIDGNSFSMEWFISRAMQTQRIVAETPTRAGIALLNAAGVAQGAAPVIVSSFESTLDDLYYTDPRHRTWHGSAVRTGQKQPLEPVNGITPPASLTQSLYDFARQPGSFWAKSSQGREYIATLGSIHWNDEPITYVGPVTN